jgi:hypothetical protein
MEVSVGVPVWAKSAGAQAARIREARRVAEERVLTQ